MPPHEEQEPGFGTLRFMREAANPDTAARDGSLDVLVRPHTHSFDAAFEPSWAGGLLAAAVADIEPREVADASGNVLRFWVEDVVLERPASATGGPLLPRECRERGTTYRGRLRCTLLASLNGGPPIARERALGAMPVMVRSGRCSLFGRSAASLVAAGEDAGEAGGYFIVNGIERIIRLLVVPRRNYPMAVVRSSLARRGPLYTEFGVSMRCVRADQSAQTVHLHYLSDGAVVLRVHVRRAEYLLPLLLVLRALVGPETLPDRAVVDAVLHGDERDTWAAGRVEGMLRAFAAAGGGGLRTQDACLSFLGERVASLVSGYLPVGATHADAGLAFLRRHVLVHLADARAKADALLLMVRKLYALASGRVSADNADAPSHHELLLPGHLLAALVKERLDEWLGAMRAQLAADARRASDALSFCGRMASGAAPYERAMARPSADVGRRVELFLASGNLASSSGLDLQQATGYTVVAERLNYSRFLSHFRSVHRGAFFAELKTTTVRKLAPESWGFMCPVHTPDGAPCGLLNHLARACRVVQGGVAREALEAAVLPRILALGAVPVEEARVRRPAETAPVLVDGRWVASIPVDSIEAVSCALRELKVIPLSSLSGEGDSPHEGAGDTGRDSAADSNTSPDALARYTRRATEMREEQMQAHAFVEVVGIPESRGGAFPGVYVFGGPARMVRPVVCFPACAGVVHVGPLEQVYVGVAASCAEGVAGAHAYVEGDVCDVLSVVASQIPFPDHNQSPRNMYQCQMGKQSMATPLHAWPRRTDTKLYRLYSPQVPVVRTAGHSRYGMDAYPSGTNAVVAVLSYTGYDMEDAMVISKGAHDRGFGHGAVYKTETIDVSARDVRGEGRTHYLGAADPRPRGLDADGLPAVGARLTPDDALYAYVDAATGRAGRERVRGTEDAYVDAVRVLGGDAGADGLCRAAVTLRLPRPPVVGDKFSSRHGQKGVCSRVYPAADMPFTESGLVPDVIINPHAFPSRMTIGMFVESLAGKAGSLHGVPADGTPFGAHGEGHTAAAYFGAQLLAAGYGYAGNEPVYSGASGRELRADVYVGVVYYQRLRHMVSDKFQVRTTGPVHGLTQQPVKGRKRAGGIRFGEMERDSLLAHGVSFLLQDRLLHCSDYTHAHVCGRCGSLLSARLVPGGRGRVVCCTCGTGAAVDVVAVPFVLRYLLAELAAMNIGVSLKTERLSA